MHVHQTLMGVNTSRAVMVVGDETSCWEDVGRKRWWLFNFYKLDSKLKSNHTKYACEHRSMTNHVKPPNHSNLIQMNT